MRNLLVIGIAIGLGFTLLGYVARTPGQTALSNAVIAIGVFILVFVLVVYAVRRFGGRDETQ